MAKCNSLFQDQQERLARNRWLIHCANLGDDEAVPTFEEYCEVFEQPSRDTVRS